MSQTNGKAVLLVNAHARRGQEWYEQALGELKSMGAEVVTAKSFTKVPALIAATKQAVADKQPLIIVGGGDGTMNAVAGFFINSESTLGVLPLGTGNAFARDLGIPSNVHAACDIALKGQAVKVDLGKIADGHFVNVATVGLTTRIARGLDDAMKRKFGRFVYVAAIVNAIRTVKPFVATLETENGREEFETMQVVIGNGRFHAGPFPILPDASITEGKLSLYALEAHTRGELIKYALLLPGGRHVQLAAVHSQHCMGGTLTTIPIRRVTVDGQIEFTTPVTFSSISRGLSVMASPDFQA